MRQIPETWEAARYTFAQELLSSRPVYVGEWQSQQTVDAANTTYEVMNAQFTMPMPRTSMDAARVIGPSMSWAEDHFQERVSGIPLNPPPSNAWWPFAVAGNALHKDEEKFSHTYPERYWPKQAEGGHQHGGPRNGTVPMLGIRFPYGDLRDVLELLKRSPYTRQAYLPVWFPEDTGSVQGQRVPCTLGYQFLIRGDQLHIFYHMRSCDFMRHLADDIYMTVRLAQWMRDKLVEHAAETDYVPLQSLTLGKLHFQAGSLHIFEPDRAVLKKMHHDMTLAYSQRLAKFASGSGSLT